MTKDTHKDHIVIWIVINTPGDCVNGSLLRVIGMSKIDSDVRLAGTFNSIRLRKLQMNE